MMVMNCIKKAEELLNQPTYMTIPADPTTKQNNNLITLLKNIKAEDGINKATYRIMYPTGQDHQNSICYQNSQSRSATETLSVQQMGSFL